MAPHLSTFIDKVKRFQVVASFIEINEKYRTPRIKMTPMVKWSLLVLRLYLIVMVLILAYKFVTLVTQ
jgi:hypothetical protein